MNVLVIATRNAIQNVHYTKIGYSILTNLRPCWKVLICKSVARCQDMTEYRNDTPEYHRARMVFGIKRTCQECQGLPVVDSCDNSNCLFHKWINNLHKQKMFALGPLASDICKYCFGVCGYWYPVCANHSKVAAQCIRFGAKESAVMCPVSKQYLGEPVRPIKETQCQK